MNLERKSRETPELDITPMIDCVFQLIMFFMVIIALVVVVGIAIRFPESKKREDPIDSKERILFAYVQRDRFNERHDIIKDGIIKICGKTIEFEPLPDKKAKAREYAKKFRIIEREIKRLIEEEGFKKDQIVITGDVLTYHWKIVNIIDAAKKNDVKGFSLTPPK